MAKHVFDNDVTTSINVKESNSTWVLEKGAVLSGSPGFYNHDYDNVTFLLSGTIKTAQQGVFSWRTDGNEGTDDVSVKLTAGARIEAGTVGVVIEGDSSDVENDGLIRSQDFEAVSLRQGQDVALVNSGRIFALSDSAVRLDGSQSFSVENSGRIRAAEGRAAIEGKLAGSGSIVNAKNGKIIGSIVFEDATGAIEVSNMGKIAQGAGANNDGITFGGGDDHLVNRGLIGGDVNFGDGDDYGDFRKGDLGGAYILGGDGNDIFVISDNTAKIFEFGNGGTDAIWTTANFTLGNTVFDSIEKLSAIGKKGIDLTGNDQANVLTGNTGDNMLSGGGGDDILAGNRGDDVLSGGDGSDDFYFYKKTGDDRIIGFNVDEDIVHLVNIPGIADMDDLQSHLSEAKNGDMVIDLGRQGSIRLAGIDDTEIDQVEIQIFSM